MTALGGELVDYSELDVAAFAEWRLRSDLTGLVVEVANRVLLNVCALIAPGFVPDPLDVAELSLMTVPLAPSGSTPTPGSTSSATPTSG